MGNKQSSLSLRRVNNEELIIQLAAAGLSLVASYYVMKWLIDYQMDKMSDTDTDTVKRLEKVLRQNGRLGKASSLNRYESKFARRVAMRDLTPVDYEKISFGSLGGLGEQIEYIRQAIIRPIERKHLLNQVAAGVSSTELVNTLGSYKSTMGLLLHGPPGTGKTALVKAAAADLNIAFMPIHIDDIMDKFVGESNKLVAAIFSLASKLSPCCLFIDEVDSLFSNRSTAFGVQDNLMLQLKSQFLSMWDGLDSNNATIILVGATNRRDMIDPAFQRRFTTKIHVPAPGVEQLEEILRLKFQGNNTELISDEQWRQLAGLAFHFGCTGADIKQVQEHLARVRIDRYLEKLGSDLTDIGNTLPELEHIVIDDLQRSILTIGAQRTGKDVSFLHSEQPSETDIE